ncbi:MAG: hypothetical protein ACE5IE_06580 [Dehalococcoidia bacterium]
MSVKQPVELASYIKGKRNVLLLTGALCDEVEFDGKKLLDYAAEIANKIKTPVAATGNTALGLKARGIETAKKKVVAEIVNSMRYPWLEPIMEEKPELLVFIGYSPAQAASLASTVKDGETVVLGNTYVAEATYSLPDASASWAQWRQHLEQLIQYL